MHETYSWGTSIKRLSKIEIRKMKANMQKVPLVKEKADSYHQYEKKEAENILNQIRSTSTHTLKKQSAFKEAEKQKTSCRKKIKNYLFNS